VALTFVDVVASINLEGTNKGLRVVDITLDNSYPTGGEAITAAQLQLSTIDFLGAEIKAPVAGDKFVSFDPANSKIVVQVMSTAAEAANASDQSTVTVRVLAFGNVE
jgi:hypothetical protein